MTNQQSKAKKVDAKQREQDWNGSEVADIRNMLSGAIASMSDAWVKERDQKKREDSAAARVKEPAIDDPAPPSAQVYQPEESEEEVTITGMTEPPAKSPRKATKRVIKVRGRAKARVQDASDDAVEVPDDEDDEIIATKSITKADRLR
jgi:hypothetical protein